MCRGGEAFYAKGLEGRTCLHRAREKEAIKETEFVVVRDEPLVPLGRKIKEAASSSGTLPSHERKKSGLLKSGGMYSEIRDL